MRELELLIPARDLVTGIAAVDYGADAVFVGGPAFGARGGAWNTVGDIARLVEYAHPYGVKVYAAINTLVYENELRQAGKLARELVSAGVDALIVQDTAFLMMGIEGIAFHASTQMTNTTPGHVAFLGKSGFSRVVLERGLTLDEVKNITSSAGVETECFIHGAVCMGYSGRCYLSRSMGPRSGNRGVCGQPCRIKYDLEDEQGRVLIKGKHLLSVKDLNMSEYIGKMIDAGVTSFKVEGRLKEAGYVKNITAFYRRLLDLEIAKRKDVKRSSDGVSVPGFEPDPAKSFTRGFTPWAAEGVKAGSACFDTPKSLRKPLGTVEKTGGGYFTLADKTVRIAPGDGICFFDGGDLTGTNINRVEAGKVYPNRTDGISPGTEVFRNYDHTFNSIAEKAKTRRTIRVQMEYDITPTSLRVTAADSWGNKTETILECRWGNADNPERSAAAIDTQLAKSGGTVFDVVAVCGVISGEMPYIPASALNALRREVLELLMLKRLEVFAKQKADRLSITTRDDSYPYPSKILGGEANVTNSLAGKFWRIHGVVKIEEAFDSRGSLDGEIVMVSPYCIRRETGSCPKDNKAEKAHKLYLRHGNFRYRLDFDCKKCLMSLVKCP